jgi:hypothetical protein
MLNQSRRCEMSPRKPTVDDLDDVDDEDGVLEDEVREETDLSLDVRQADEVGLGGTGDPAAERDEDKRRVEDDDIEEEE